MIMRIQDDLERKILTAGVSFMAGILTYQGVSRMLPVNPLGLIERGALSTALALLMVMVVFYIVGGGKYE